MFGTKRLLVGQALSSRTMDKIMLISEREQIQHLSVDVLVRRAETLEREAGEEQVRADAARARIGEAHCGPESYEQLMDIRQRMADGRRESARIYREAVASRAFQTFFLSNLLAKCDVPCPATQDAIDMMAETNGQTRARMLEWLGRISRDDLCDAILVAWAKVPLERATGRSRDGWLDVMKLVR